jgi:hypothetical protein
MLWSLMLVFYGVVPHPLLLFALLSCGGFIAAGIVTLSNPIRGRMIAVCALIAVAPLWVVWIIELVPQYSIRFSLLTYALLPIYVVVLAFVLFLPHRLRFSITIIVVVCCSAGILAWGTYVKRVQGGEYDRPGVACFRWRTDPANQLVILRDPINWIDARARHALEQAHIHGTLQWTGSVGEPRLRNRMIVLLQTKPANGTRLYPPRDGVLLYAFDGQRWLKSPGDAPTYPLFLTLEDKEGHTMLYEQVDGGKQGSEAFR